MGEERFVVKPYGVRYKCDCGGEMKPSSHILMSFPPQYPHECEKCGKGVDLSERYPTVKWEEIMESSQAATGGTNYE
jgi:hypothetical protein